MSECGLPAISRQIVVVSCMPSYGDSLALRGTLTHCSTTGTFSKEHTCYYLVGLATQAMHALCLWFSTTILDLPFQGWYQTSAP